MVDQGSSKMARKLRAWLYLAVSVGMAILSLDTLISGLWDLAVGTPGYLLKIALGLLGLLLGLYLILRFVYRYDRRQGRVKKEIRILGGKVNDIEGVQVNSTEDERNGN